jgi:hypothetical protein
MREGEMAAWDPEDPLHRARAARGMAWVTIVVWIAIGGAALLHWVAR